ncbi:hypothetical protein ACHAXN_012094 [Cyclotella atomus]
MFAIPTVPSDEEKAKHGHTLHSYIGIDNDFVLSSPWCSAFTPNQFSWAILVSMTSKDTAGDISMFLCFDPLRLES